MTMLGEKELSELFEAREDAEPVFIHRFRSMMIFASEIDAHQRKIYITLMDARRQISELSKTLDNGKATMRQLFESLITLANEFDEKQRKLNIAKVSLSCTGVVGGAMTVIGIALSPFTFGASLGLTIAGGIVGSGSSIGNISALAVDNKITHRALEDAQNLLRNFNEQSEVIRSRLEKFIGMLNEEDRVFAQNLIENCCLPSDERKLLIDMLKYCQRGEVKLRIKIIKFAVVKMISAVAIIVKAAKTGKTVSGMAAGTGAAAGAANVGKSIGKAVDIGTDAAASTGKGALSGAKAAGIAFGVAGIAIDFGTMIYYSHKIHKNEPSHLAKKIREVAKCLQ